ncbi:Rossmann-like domain-containing protein [Streptomyces phaeochromogenes]|uniref:Rossmann-like domain-containing protein n=1 Tax=Streptomyces phaeochromogenes TaxID=1923 RepID=UPI00371195E3
MSRAMGAGGAVPAVQERAPSASDGTSAPAASGTSTPARLGTSAPGPSGTSAPASYDDLVSRVLAGRLGPDPRTLRIAVAFTTSQAVRHDGRRGGYRNEVLSLRLDRAVGSCAVEPGALSNGALSEGAVEDCAGADVARLLEHPLTPVRVAALDAYLMHVAPHTPENGALPRSLSAGSSVEKSRARAKAVVELLDVRPGQTVLVVGVVNSLLEALRSRGVPYIPCDLKGGRTEWGEPIVTDALAELDRCDAVLASGMTLGNGSFDPLREHALRTDKQLVMFAQTGSAVLPRFLGAGVSAVCAEPYPFFWLDGGPGVIHRYGHGHGYRDGYRHGHRSGHPSGDLDGRTEAAL